MLLKKGRERKRGKGKAFYASYLDSAVPQVDRNLQRTCLLMPNLHVTICFVNSCQKYSEMNPKLLKILLLKVIPLLFILLGSDFYWSKIKLLEWEAVLLQVCTSTREWGFSSLHYCSIVAYIKKLLDSQKIFLSLVSNKPYFWDPGDSLCKAACLLNAG